MTSSLLNLDNFTTQEIVAEDQHIFIQPQINSMIFQSNNLIESEMKMDTSISTSATKPYMVVTEQPIEKFRFRYKSEMHGTHGSLTGITTSRTNKTFPSVQLYNFDGEATIRCSLYQSSDQQAFPHSHSLVVRKGNKDEKDPHDVVVSAATGYTAVFQGMGIIHTAKKFTIEELCDKLRRQLLFEKQRPITELEEEKLRRQAISKSRGMNMNQVCLCFEAFTLIDGQHVSLCEPVLSNSINNMKSALTGELKITRLSTAVSSAAGNVDLFLFVEKVGKKNIKVRFFELNDDEEVIWEDFGKFSEADVHHQYAIALKTPPYKDIHITEYVKVFIQLLRPTDKDISEPVSFQYKPSRSTFTMGKRPRIDSEYNSAEFLPTVIDEQMSNKIVPITISEEYNKSGMINKLCENGYNSMNLQSDETWEKFLKLVATDSVSNELATFLDDPFVYDGPANKNNKINSHVSQTSVDFIEKEINNIIDSSDITTDDIKNKLSLFIRRQYLNNFYVLEIALISSEELFNILLNLIDQFKLTFMLYYVNNLKENLLHIAVLHNKPQYLKLLIKMGTPINRVDKDGNTPLHIAIMENQINCIKELLSFRDKTMTHSSQLININAYNDNSQTPLFLAIQQKNIDLVKLLLENNAKTHLCDIKTGNNILHMAVVLNWYEFVEYILLHQFIDVNAKNSSNFTPLDLAIAQQSINDNIVQILLKYNATETIDNNKDDTDTDESISTVAGQMSALTGFEEIHDNSGVVIDELSQKNAINTIKMSTDLDVPIIKTEIKTELHDKNYDDYELETVAKRLNINNDDSSTNKTIPHKSQSNSNDVSELFDETCLKDLCTIFNRDNKWNELANAMGYQAFTNVWKTSKNPSKMLFKFSEIQATRLKYFVTLFTQIESREALSCINEMIARRIEDDE